jgi:hypothetical protein
VQSKLQKAQQGWTDQKDRQQAGLFLLWEVVRFEKYPRYLVPGLPGVERTGKAQDRQYPYLFHLWETICSSELPLVSMPGVPRKSKAARTAPVIDKDHEGLRNLREVVRDLPIRWSKEVLLQKVRG